MSKQKITEGWVADGRTLYNISGNIRGVGHDEKIDEAGLGRLVECFVDDLEQRREIEIEHRSYHEGEVMDGAGRCWWLSLGFTIVGDTEGEYMSSGDLVLEDQEVSHA